MSLRCRGTLTRPFSFDCYHCSFCACLYYTLLLLSANHSEGWLEMSSVVVLYSCMLVRGPEGTQALADLLLESSNKVVVDYVLFVHSIATKAIRLD